MPRAKAPKGLPKNDRSILLKMPTALHAKAVAVAAARGLTVSALLRCLVLEEAVRLAASLRAAAPLRRARIE